MYKVVLSRQSERFYKKLEETTKAKVRECLISLEDNICAGKRLHGDLKDHLSFRIGKLRIISTVVEKEKIVYIIAIGPRKTIYE